MLSLFGSKSKEFATIRTDLLTLINNLLTLILSKADSEDNKVFCPQIIFFVPGKDVIGLISESYKSSKLFLLSLTDVDSTADNTPLFLPAGAAQGAAILSFKEYAPKTATDGGTLTNPLVEGSLIVTSGKYAAAKDVFKFLFLKYYSKIIFNLIFKLYFQTNSKIASFILGSQNAKPG